MLFATSRLSVSPLRNAATSLLALAVLMLLVARPAEAQERDPDLVPHPNSEARNAPLTNAARAQALSAADVAQALDLDAEDVLSVDFGSSDVAGFGVLSGGAAGFPQQGDNYLALSSGFTSVALDNNTSASTSGDQEGTVTPGGGNDMVQMEIELNVPEGASSLSFDFKFFSEEFPEFVGSGFNDGFVVEIGTSTFTVNGSTVNAPDNIVFDENDDLITVNTVFGVSESNAAGTTYDGATPTLTTTISNISSSTITLIFSVFDVGDDIYDSTVFLDNLTFGAGGSTTPLELVGLEVNQSIQSWENSVPLIENKPTLVRAHLQTKSSSTESGVAVKLAGTRNGNPLPGSPQPAQNIANYIAPKQASSAATITERRADLSQSLNFSLPDSWLSGTVDLELVGGNVDCNGAVATDENCELQVSFESVPRPLVVFYGINWTDNNGQLQEPEFDLDEVTGKLNAMYPVERLTTAFGGTLDVPYQESSDAGPPTIDEVENLLEDQWDLDVGGGPLNENIIY